jgi:deoxyribonuclease-4
LDKNKEFQNPLIAYLLMQIMAERARIKFGPAGLGPVKTAVKTLEKFKSMGLEACEIAFTYGAYMKEPEAREIGEVAKKLGIQLSIHAPYFVNLNSDEKAKIEASKKRIEQSLKVGTYLGAKYIVFHPGFYGKMPRSEAYENIKNAILDLQKIRKEKGYTPKLAPETMGKINVFGSIEEISRLVRDTGCHACIDFAHVLARSGGDYRFKETLKLFENLEELHIHFSGMIFGEKGEKKHKPTESEEWELLLGSLPKDKKIVIINESPTMIDDSVEGLKISSEKF